MEEEVKLRRWTQGETEWLFQNINKLPISDICTKLGRNENAIKLKLHRHRSSAYAVVKDNVMLRVITKKFGNPELFNPTRSFYIEVKIKQKRFWAIYKGVEKITNEELLRVTNFFNISHFEYLDAVQLTFEGGGFN